MLPPEVLVAVFEHVHQARCQRGLDALKRVSKIFWYLLSSSKFFFCTLADYPHTRNKYSSEEIQDMRFCCYNRMRDYCYEFPDDISSREKKISLAIGIPEIKIYH